MKAPVSSRFAHSDGITDIALYEPDGGRSKIVTCGSDGDIRVWSEPDDPEPLILSASDTSMSIHCRGNSLFAGTENNTVEQLSLPSGEKEKVVCRFTETVNHVDVSKTGAWLAAGSGDMTVQIIRLSETSSQPVKINAHAAPVLSVAIDPKEEFVVSTGCDGMVCVWTMVGKQVKFWDGVFQSCNDISLSKTLCRPAWSSSGEVLAVPCKGEVVLYQRGTWDRCGSLKAHENKIMSVVTYSSSQTHIAAGSADGDLYVWEVESSKLIYQNFESKDCICGITFSTTGKDILAVDLKGRMIFVKDYHKSVEMSSEDVDMSAELGGEDDFDVDKNAVAEDGDDDPFDDDMDDAFLGGGEPGANEISISEIKARAGFVASDKEDVFVGIDKAVKAVGLKKPEADDDAVSVSSFTSQRSEGKIKQYRPEPVEIPFTEPQPSFQPSSSPVHLQHRFMAWNSIGIIRNYEIDEDELDSIDVEFHDVSFHNSIRLRNQNDYTIAALGKEAVIFTSPRNKDSLSKINCFHFSAWDNNKEWTLELPKNEEATGAAIGSGWFAVGTDMNRLRIFTVGGVQRNVIDIGGQIIAISGHEDLLFVVFHTGIGLYGNQCISYSILQIRGGTGVFPLLTSDKLPLSPKSQVTWIGFSDEGTPAFSDSTEVLRILSGRMWTTFLCMKEDTKSDTSVHYWVTGLSICQQQARVIKCKGTRYPPTLPRPNILLLDAKMPLCEMDTEKSILEDSYLRLAVQHALTKKMDKKGFDVEDYKATADKEIKETLVKLFALSCKGDRDFRASEYVSMMPSTQTIQLAIKYASKVRKLALMERLNGIGRKKMDEQEEGVEADDDDFENIRTGNVIYSSVYSTLGSTLGGGDESSTSIMGNSSFNTSKSQIPEVVFLKENPLLMRQRDELQPLCASIASKNPFKKGKQESTAAEVKSAPSTSEKNESTNGRGLSLIDAWKKPKEKPSAEVNTKQPKTKNSRKSQADKGKDKDKVEKPSNPEKKKQPTLFAMTEKKNQSEKENNELSSILIEDSSSNTSDPDAMSTSKDVTNGQDDTARKRKRSDDETNTGDSEKKSRITAKFSAFLKNKSKTTEEDELEDV